MTTLAAINRAFPTWAPPPRLTVSQWADRNRILSPESSAEPGRWSSAHATYQPVIMDALSDAAVEVIVAMWAAQTGKTSCVENMIGFHVDQDPAPMMLLQPTLEIAEAVSKDRIAPMVRDTPPLPTPRCRGSTSTGAGLRRTRLCRSRPTAAV